MQITEITLTGETGCKAIIRRRTDQTTFITGTYPTGKGEAYTYALRAKADDDTVWNKAFPLQAQLDGYHGTGGDIAEYYQVLSNFRA